jgi:hypothetical protein
MKLRRWLAIGSTLLLGACGGVTKAEFDAYKADEVQYRAAIKLDGEKLDAWVKSAHENIMWLRQSVITLCPTCTPPTAPPNPPPDGNWGI